MAAPLEKLQNQAVKLELRMKTAEEKIDTNSEKVEQDMETAEEAKEENNSHMKVPLSSSRSPSPFKFLTASLTSARFVRRRSILEAGRLRCDWLLALFSPSPLCLPPHPRHAGHQHA